MERARGVKLVGESLGCREGRCTLDERTNGCPLCGGELVYLPMAEPVRCVSCGAGGTSAARCPLGHYLCDDCHSGSAKGVIEQICGEAAGRDPVEIALGLMRNPKLQMHGPEHHFLVPATLLAAFSNARGEPWRRRARVAEARRRSEPVGGGFCGLQGACGAAIGAGIFVAIATEASPLRGPERGLANRMTAGALAVIGARDVARCCKRDSLLAILSAARYARRHLGVDLPARGPSCEFSRRNRQCAAAACPFHRDTSAEAAPSALPCSSV